MKHIVIFSMALFSLIEVQAQHGRHHHNGNGNFKHHRGPVFRGPSIVIAPQRPMFHYRRPMIRPVYVAPRPVVVVNVPIGSRRYNPVYQNNCQHTSGTCNHNSQVHGMGQAVYSDLVQQMRETSYDSDRLIIAKEAIQYNSLSADQIRGVMLEMTYESSRLEFAKYAYNYCADPQNYFQVNSAFAYSSSIQELSDFLPK